MTPRNHHDELRDLLGRPAPPAGLAERVLDSVRELGERGTAALTFDIAASAEGIVGLRPGSGQTEGGSRRARAFAERAREELAEYLDGSRSFFTVPVDLSAAAAFQHAVLTSARAIPFGEVRSYRWIAERVGAPQAVRAVGTALGRNPVPIIVPCHRVLRSDGSLGGYAFGLDWKARLLDLERETPALVGSDTTRIVCRHGCPDEQSIGERHRVVFSSVREARAAGYRPCHRCLAADR